MHMGIDKTGNHRPFPTILFAFPPKSGVDSDDHSRRDGDIAGSPSAGENIEITNPAQNPIAGDLPLGCRDPFRQEPSI
jgi:hypothetical protein